MSLAETIDVGSRETLPEHTLRGVRVCMVHYSPFEIDSRVQRQARVLAELGADIHCVCMSDAEVLPVGHGRITLHRVYTEKPRQGARQYLKGYAGFFTAALRKISQLDAQHSFDLVEVHNMPNFLTFAAIRPKLRGTPVMLDVHDTFPELFATKFGIPMNSGVVRLMKLEERASSLMADGMLAVTDEARLRLASRGSGRGKTAVVMNSPDEQVFGPQREPVELPSDGAVRVVYHGGVAPRFGVEALVKGFAQVQDRLPNASLEIWGAAAAENAQIAALAGELAPAKIDVAANPIPFSEIPGILAKCHIGVVPTLDDEFTELLLPVKLMEYIHMGIPVITSRLPVVEHYFSSDEVYFVEPGSPSALANALVDVASDPDGARERAIRASERLVDIAWTGQRRRYLSVVQSLLNRK